MALKSLRQWDNNMRRYLRIYKAIIKINIAYILTYRANFFNGMISSFLWGAFNVMWVTLITYKAKQAFGWQSNDLVIISIGYVILTGFSYTLFAHNFENFSRIIDRGEFDSVLLKPVDSQFHISTTRISIGSFIRTITGGSFLIWWVTSHHYVIGPVQLISFLLLLGVGVCLMYSIWFIFITSLIWYPNLSNLTELLYTFNGFARYPAEMIRSSGSFLLFFFLPISLIVATPVKVLLQKNAWGDMSILFGLSIFLLYLSRIWWKHALKSYTSAS